MAILGLSNEAKDLKTVVLQELTYLEQHALAKPEISAIAKVTRNNSKQLYWLLKAQCAKT